MGIHKLSASDLPLLAALQPEGWASIAPAFQYYTQSDFCFPIKFTVEEKIAGVGTTIIHNGTAWLAHIIVAPQFRNLGIGTSITQALVDSLKQSSCSTILLLATPLGEVVYKKIGFSKESEYLFFKGGTTKTPLLNSILSNPSFHNQILELDFRVSGEDRSKVLIPHLNPDYAIGFSNA